MAGPFVIQHRRRSEHLRTHSGSFAIRCSCRRRMDANYQGAHLPFHNSPSACTRFWLARAFSAIRTRSFAIRPHCSSRFASRAYSILAQSRYVFQPRWSRKIALSVMRLSNSTATPNHALQRTAPAVTLAAPPPSPAQPSRQPPPSLSLGSFGDFAHLSRAMSASEATSSPMTPAKLHGLKRSSSRLGRELAAWSSVASSLSSSRRFQSSAFASRQRVRQHLSSASIARFTRPDARHAAVPCVSTARQFLAFSPLHASGDSQLFSIYVRASIASPSAAPGTPIWASVLTQ